MTPLGKFVVRCRTAHLFPSLSTNLLCNSSSVGEVLTMSSVQSVNTTSAAFTGVSRIAVTGVYVQQVLIGRGMLSISTPHPKGCRSLMYPGYIPACPKNPEENREGVGCMVSATSVVG